MYTKPIRLGNKTVGDNFPCYIIAEIGSNFNGNIEKAKKLSKEVNFVTDDFLNSKLHENEFDFILDRGCFHVFDIKQRPTYVTQIKRILKKNGILCQL